MRTSLSPGCLAWKSGIAGHVREEAQLVRRKTRLALLPALASVLLLTACGSRRPMRDFVAVGSPAHGGTALGQTAPNGVTQLPAGCSSAAPGVVQPGGGNGGPAGANGGSSS